MTVQRLEDSTYRILPCSAVHTAHVGIGSPLKHSTALLWEASGNWLANEAATCVHNLLQHQGMCFSCLPVCVWLQVDGYAPFCKHVFVPNFVGTLAAQETHTQPCASVTPPGLLNPV